MDVGVWLRSLGLGEYEDKFRDNRIDADILTQLTADDLKDIGVSAVGDRRRLLAAIGALASSPLSAASLASAPENLKSAIFAERRPITVMFCDLVGSTSLAAKLDAEDWRNLVNTYLDEASKAVRALGGRVLKKLGDGLMALFGYPHAQENDAERAVRAALAIQRAIAEINVRNAQSGVPELAARIGLDTGSVVVDSAGEVFGETPNVAARVQAAAEPGTVLVTSAVQRQVAGLFIAEDKGPHELKGVGASVTLYSVLRISGGRRRKGARVLTPFVGREEDIGVLASRWERARSGEGQFVLISGEPRHRQVTPPRRISRPTWRNPLLMDRVEFVAAVAEHALAPDRRMGPRPVWRSRGGAGATARRARVGARRHQARPGGACTLGCAAGRHSDPDQTLAGPSAGRDAPQAIGGDGCLGDRRGAGATDRFDL
jgi:class 3 adenylate cyclase